MNLKKAAQKKLKKSGGFTLVEMLIVVAIIAILVVVSIPMVSSSLDKARTATDDANFRAAKSAALIEYMNTGLAGTYKYDAADGTVSTTETPEGYNQATHDDIGRGNGYVQVVITEETDTTPFSAVASWTKIS